MNRLIYISTILFLIMLTLFSCERKKNTYFELIKTLNNETNREFLYFIKTDVGSDSILSFGNDSVSMKFAKNSTVIIPPIGPYSSIDIESVRIETEVLYDLTDTSYFRFNLYRNEWNKNDSLYWDMISYKVEGGKGLHEIHTERLIFSDTLKSIFNKDYSMLEKFKDYYKK